MKPNKTSLKFNRALNFKNFTFTAIIIPLSIINFNSLNAQENLKQSPVPAISSNNNQGHSIVLEKVFPVYLYEGKEIKVNEYQIKPNDNLKTIIQKHKLPDTTETNNFIKALNPNINNFTNLKPGQFILLPNDNSYSTPQKNDQNENIENGDDRQDNAQQQIKYNRTQPNQKEAIISSSNSDSTEKNLKQQNEELNKQEEEKRKNTTIKETVATTKEKSNTVYAQSKNKNLGSQTPDGTVYRTVKVKKGDTIERLLRREGMDPNLIYRELLKVTKELNPEIKDLNMIYVGAEIKIPSSKEYLANQSIDNKQTSDKTLTATAPGEEAEKTGKENIEPKANEETIDKKELVVTNLPPKNVLAIHYTLNTIFAKLGESVSARGHVLLPLPNDKQIDIDTIQFPIINLKNGKYIILDTQNKLPQETVKALTDHFPKYKIFNINPKETLPEAIDRLWILCGYYKIHKKGNPYEGGANVILSIDADWLIWPSAESWNAGQPFAMNLITSATDVTPAPWANFLNEHGIKIVDIYKNNIITDNKEVTLHDNIKTIDIDTQNPNNMVKLIANTLGTEAKSVADLGSEDNQLMLTENTLEPVYWEYEKNKSLIEFGILSEEKAKDFRNQGYKIISSQIDDQSILRSVLYGFNLTAKNTFVIHNEGGGPKMSLIVLGQSFKHKDKNYLFTSANLPSNISLLNPNLKLTIFKHNLPMTPWVKAKPEEAKNGTTATKINNKKQPHDNNKINKKSDTNNVEIEESISNEELRRKEKQDLINELINNN